jgi:hypothetical protein
MSNKYLCGVTVEAGNLEEASWFMETPEGYNRLVIADTITCMKTDVIDPNIGGIIIFLSSMIFLIGGIVLGFNLKSKSNKS